MNKINLNDIADSSLKELKIIIEKLVDVKIIEENNIDE